MDGNESNVACLNIKSCFWSIYSKTVQEKKFDDQNYGAIVMAFVLRKFVETHAFEQSSLALILLPDTF